MILRLLFYPKDSWEGEFESACDEVKLSDDMRENAIDELSIASAPYITGGGGIAIGYNTITRSLSIIKGRQ